VRSAARTCLAALALAGAADGGAAQGTYPGPYEGTVLRIIDGDTFEALIGIWPTIRSEVSVRIAGVDAPETFRPACEAERLFGRIASADLTAELPPGSRVQLRDVRADAFSGRVLAEVYRPAEDGPSLPIAEALLERGIARPWRPSDPSPDWCRIFGRGGR
jgi:micrococcal nuclease